MQITHQDYQRLHTLINHFLTEKREKVSNLEALRVELEKAKMVDSQKISSDFITMNSEFEVEDTSLGRLMVFKLVYPQLADFKNGKLSVLSPLGCALIGCRAGDEIEFTVPAGKKKVRITRILYQPEANGMFEL